MIEIVHQRENEDDQTVFFKTVIDNEVYEWHGDCPKDADPKAYFEAIKDKIHFLILQKMYPGADWRRFQKEGMSDLASMQEWIAKGHKNKIVVGYDEKEKPVCEYRVIEKKPWRSTHPPGLALKAEVDKVTTLAGLKTVVKKFINV